MNGIPTHRLAQFKQPEYTGTNRCTPCTIVNLGITAVLSLAVGFLSPLAAAVLAGTAILTIYFRGYLVPGTPTLTKRYFPEPLLRWFDKSHGTTLHTDLDPETQLLELGVIEPYKDDLQLTDSFAAEWKRAIKRTRANTEAEVADVLDLTCPTIQEAGVGWAIVGENVVVATWPSRAALLADIAAIPLLQTRSRNWTALSESEQTQLLGSLRIFLDACPTCGGTLEFYEDTAESCCRTATVTSYECSECHDPLLELQQ